MPADCFENIQTCWPLRSCLLGYFVFSGVHSGAFCTKATGARTRLQKKIQPVHMNGRALRWMRKASALPLQLV